MRKNIIINVLIGVLTAALTTGVFFLGFYTYKWSLSDTERTLLEILDNYEENYYYKSDDVIDVICDAIFDDYSTYYTPEEYESVKSVNLGKSVGVGISMIKGSNEIYEVAINSSAYQSGVKTGGKVILAKIGGKEYSGDDISTPLLSLSTGDEVELTIDYQGDIEVYNLKKQVYNRSYVTYRNANGTFVYEDNNSAMNLVKYSDKSIGSGGVGYIKYTAFNGQKDDSYGSVYQMKTALEKFKADGNKTLILDIRNNGGGYFNVLSPIAGMLVEKHGENQVASISKNRDGEITYHYIKNNVYDSFGFEKIIVLANRKTASASEVLIGAMLDYDTQNKVTVILDGYESNGETVYKTYGKGIMQTTYKYSNGSAIKLTTAKIYWPVSNISIHGVGITTGISSKVLNAVNGDAYEYALSLLK